MAEKSAQEKTEKPTPRRRQQAREKGQVAKSQEMGSVGVLLAGVLGLWMLSGYIFTHITDFMRHVLMNSAAWHIDDAMTHNISLMVMEIFAFTLAPLMLVLCLAAALANVAQVGFMVAPKRLKPDLGRLNPVSGFKKFVSMRVLVDLFKNIGKLAVVGGVSYAVMAAEWDRLPNLGGLEVPTIILYFGKVCLELFFWAVLAMVALAIMDYAYQKYDFEKNLKMSKQEIKDDHKQTEGDPHVRARIRSIQREAARKRMMSSVPEADVVITNPTHLAVALKYDAAAMESPEVVAKGAGKIAERIKEMAREAGVPVIEDKPLAQSLFKSVEVGQAIPYDLYEAVATLLAHVYRLRNQHEQVLETIGRNRRGEVN